MGSTRARAPPSFSDGSSRKVVFLCCFFSLNLGRVRVLESTLRLCQKKLHTVTRDSLSHSEIREKRNIPLQSYTEAVWLRASRSKGFAKTSVSVRSRNVATSRETAGGERLATCSGCSCRSSSIVSMGLSRVAGSQSARVAWGAWLISALSMACHNWCLPCTRWLSTE